MVQNNCWPKPLQLNHPVNILVGTLCGRIFRSLAAVYIRKTLNLAVQQKNTKTTNVVSLKCFTLYSVNKLILSVFLPNIL